MGDDMKHDVHKGHEMDTAKHGDVKHKERSHIDHHAHLVAELKRRFWVSLIITVPILILSPVIQEWIGIDNAIRFSGDLYVLFALSSVVFFYGGYPFLRGLFDDLESSRPGDDDTHCHSHYNGLPVQQRCGFRS